MNKLLAFLMLIIFTFYNLQAQDGFVKYRSDANYRDSIIVYKGEILPFTSTQNPNRINVTIDRVTITDLNKNSDEFVVVPSVDTSYYLRKGEFLQLKEDDKVWLNTTNILIAEYITLISENGDQVIQLINKRDTIVNLASLGRTCRLIISNCPTMFYSTDELTPYVEPELATQDSTQPEPATPLAQKQKNWPWWYSLIIAVAVTGVGFVIWLILKQRNRSNVNKVKFTGNSLTKFANKYGGLDKLNKLNPVLIPTKNQWNTMNENDKFAKIKELKGKRIIIKPDSENPFSFQESNNNQSNDEQINESESETKKDVNVSSTDLGKNEEISKQLRQLENNLIKEIQKINSANNSAAELNRLQDENKVMENKLIEFENEKTIFAKQIKELQESKINIEDKLKIVINDKKQFENKINVLKDKVNEIDFLKNYSESIIVYFKFCQQVVNDAFSFYNRINQQNPKQSFVAGQLLMKFQSNINTIPYGNWIQMVQDIVDTGVTNNRRLIRSFAQCEKDSDIIKEFQRLLYSEVLIKYSSNLLILAEAFSKLPRFNVESGLAIESQSVFGKHVLELVNKAKSAGLEIKHASLFENFEKYLGDVDSVDSDRSFPYKEINDLEKGSIAEIVSFGMKTIFEDTKTIIILA